MELFALGRERIGRVVAGQRELIDQALLTLLWLSFAAGQTPPPVSPAAPASAAPPAPDPKAVHESGFETVSESKPGGFKNDPNDPTSPNEAIERSRRALRRPLPPSRRLLGRNK